jgi:hypothetical protein
MADWKQITARIRRARTGKDPAAQLSNLFEKTHDAMVAFELARYLETSGQRPDAARWYTTAAEKFRRADWKTKAQDAATRLAGLPADEPANPDESAVASVVTVPEPALPFVQNAEAFETLAAPADVSAPAESESTSDTDSVTSADSSTGSPDSGTRGRRRRGRRGGRNRNKRASPATPATHSDAHSKESPRRPSASRSASEPPASRFDKAAEAPALRLPIEPASEQGGVAPRGRYGDPGLSSRLSLLEMQFRRLLNCNPVNLDDNAAIPAGPGVFLLTDSDLTSYYYVEACQTLRIAIPNLLRGGASRRGVDSIKPQLADHLGIAETRVGKYLADHCVVRWLQLDEGASHFAHFVMAVLRPVLNE